jgi:hypothetical protein
MFAPKLPPIVSGTQVGGRAASTRGCRSTVLVRHGGPADPETRGQLTVKLYRKENAPSGETRIALQSANPEVRPLVITSSAVAVRVIAEVV